MKSQTIHDYLSNLFQEEVKKRPKSIIFTANVCCGCLGEITHEGFLFIEDTLNRYKVRYLKYIQSPVRLKILKDEIFEDNNIKDIFKIFSRYHSSIIWEMKNIENILADTVIKNGEVFVRLYPSDGIMKRLEIYYKGEIISSVYPTVCINEVFEKAYYYWLLYSAINNYINDSLRQNLEKNRNKKYKNK